MNKTTDAWDNTQEYGQSFDLGQPRQEQRQAENRETEPNQEQQLVSLVDKMITDHEARLKTAIAHDAEHQGKEEQKRVECLQRAEEKGRQVAANLIHKQIKNNPPEPIVLGEFSGICCDIEGFATTLQNWFKESADKFETRQTKTDREVATMLTHEELQSYIIGFVNKFLAYIDGTHLYGFEYTIKPLLDLIKLLCIEGIDKFKEFPKRKNLIADIEKCIASKLKQEEQVLSKTVITTKEAEDRISQLRKVREILEKTRQLAGSINL